MTTTTQDNKAIVQRFIDEVVNGKDFDLVEELLTSDYTRHDPASLETQSGLGTWIESMKVLHAGFPDEQVHVGELIAEGDLVAFEGTMSATHTGKFMGLEPTNESFEVQGNAMHRIRDGRIAESWATWDFLGILQQIGAVDPALE